MSPRVVVPLLVLAAGAVAAYFHFRDPRGAPHFTGFVEGEERVIRSEVSGRVLEVRFQEGDPVPAHEVLAVLDDRDIASRLQTSRQQLAVIDRERATQSDRIALVEATWTREVAARRADVQLAEAAADLADRTYEREVPLGKAGISTAQQLDDLRSRRDQARSAVARAREMLARTEAEEGSITLARRELETLEARRALAEAQTAELEVMKSKYVIRAPAAATSMQTRFVWPGELAQPGTAVAALIDPRDKYVQIYVPVADSGRLRIGQRVAIELDSRPGRRVPGEISFIADRANFTPEKIETRSDRLGQVYRVKVRILEDVESFQPGTEGNVYLVDGAA